jgi:excisionase family DNA binding protein
VYKSRFEGRFAVETTSAGDWPEIMTVEQVAAYLQLNKMTIYRYIRARHLRAARIGKAFRIRKADVDAFLQSQTARPSRRRARRPSRQPSATQPAPDHAAVVGLSRLQLSELRNRVLTVNPIEWVIRGLR